MKPLVSDRISAAAGAAGVTAATTAAVARQMVQRVRRWRSRFCTGSTPSVESWTQRTLPWPHSHDIGPRADLAPPCGGSSRLDTGDSASLWRPGAFDLGAGCRKRDERRLRTSA